MELKTTYFENTGKENTEEVFRIVKQRAFGQGMKVVLEITTMAADGGLIGTDQDVIAIAGTGRGADLAVVLRPVNSNDFFDLKVKEILCKPHF